MELIDRLNEAYDALRAMGRVHTRRDFALLIGANETTISRAFNKDPRYLTRNLVKKAEAAVGELPEKNEPATVSVPEPKGVYIPEETVKLYNNMSESIRILSETIARMQGGDIRLRAHAPSTRVDK